MFDLGVRKRWDEIASFGIAYSHGVSPGVLRQWSVAPQRVTQGRLTPPTLPSWQVAGRSYACRKGGTSSMQMSCVCHGHFLFVAVPSSFLRCSLDTHPHKQIAEQKSEPCPSPSTRS